MKIVVLAGGLSPERERLPELHLEDCMECGCCSYICPSHIPLADLVRQARQLPREGGEQE